MKFFKKRRLQQQLFQFWNQYHLRKGSLDDKLSDNFIAQFSEILQNSDIPLSDIDHSNLWEPLLNAVTQHSFSERALSLVALALRHGLPVSEQAVLHVAGKLDRYSYHKTLENGYKASLTNETNYRNSAGLKKFLELLSAFDAPWATTTYRRPGYDDCTVAQYLATKQIDSKWAVENGRFVPSVNLSVFTSFFQKSAAQQPVNSLSVDSILSKRQEERFAQEPEVIDIVTQGPQSTNPPDMITIITDDSQLADIQSDNPKTKPHSTKLHF